MADSVVEEIITLCVPASRMDSMRKFYISVLTPLNYAKITEKDHGTLIGYGDGKHEPKFWLKAVTDGQTSPSTYVTFDAPSKESVDIFYNIALQKGAKHEEKPNFGGVVVDEEPCYTASVLDPEGNELRAINGQPFVNTC